ncbi:hypothetical protein MBLNU230_g1911t1 [Neophaeotheca triangularis]
MDASLLRPGFKRAIAACHAPARRRAVFPHRRHYATPTSTSNDDIKPAAPINFTRNRNQFARGQDRSRNRDPNRRFSPRDEDADEFDSEEKQRALEQRKLLDSIRIVPASPSYFTATPTYTDDLLHLSSLLRRHQLLPLLPTGQAPRVAWKTYQQYKAEVGEPVKAARYNRLLELLKRLNYIHPSLIPQEVTQTLRRYKRDVQPSLNIPKPIVVDEYGRARAMGRRKASSAIVYLVEGEGECIVNGRSLSEYFGRLHDRESAVWALKATQRLDKYNVWAVAQGGGLTGQADAITLGVAKALLAHEPALKPALRRAGTVTRDPRRVERKKPGRVKARKMPTWVKR